MIFNKEIARKTAEVLLQVNAIKLSPSEPFTWASGWKSPIYCDNRIILSFPTIRNYIREIMGKEIEKLYGKPDVIAGVATGAIGIGMLVAEYLGLPFIYVRPEAKGHGRQNQIEGYLEKGHNVVVVEDLISTGNSSLNAVRALKENDATHAALTDLIQQSLVELHRIEHFIGAIFSAPSRNHERLGQLLSKRKFFDDGLGKFDTLSGMLKSFGKVFLSP